MVQRARDGSVSKVHGHPLEYPRCSIMVQKDGIARYIHVWVSMGLLLSYNMYMPYGMDGQCTYVVVS